MRHQRPVGREEGIDIARHKHLPDCMAGGIVGREGILERIAHWVSRI
jgi:hypothetical protein